MTLQILLLPAGTRMRPSGKCARRVAEHGLGYDIDSNGAKRIGGGMPGRMQQSIGEMCASAQRRRHDRTGEQPALGTSDTAPSKSPRHDRMRARRIA